MKIGIDAHGMGRRSSGNETYYAQLLKNLAAAPTNGSQYVVYYTHLAAAGLGPVSEKFHLKRIRPATPFWRIPVGFPLGVRRGKLHVFNAQYMISPFCTCKSVTT